MARITVTSRPGGTLVLGFDSEAQRRIDAACAAGIPALRIADAAHLGGGPRSGAPIFLLTGAPRLPLRVR